MNTSALTQALNVMAGRHPSDQSRLDSGDLGSTPLIRPYELTQEILAALPPSAADAIKEQR